MNDTTCAACGRTLAAREKRLRIRATRPRNPLHDRRPWRDFRVEAASRGLGPLFRIHG
jgi:hypothetical protein